MPPLFCPDHPARSSESDHPITIRFVAAFRERDNFGKKILAATTALGLAVTPLGAPAVGSPAHAQPPPATKEVDGQVSSRSEEHTSELQSLMRISYALFCLQ